MVEGNFRALPRALIAHPFPLVVEALAALVAGAGYCVVRAVDAAATAAALATKLDLALISADLEDAVERPANGTRTLMIDDAPAGDESALHSDDVIILTAPVHHIAAIIAAAAPPRPAVSPLTARERDVARLVAAGQRNRSIAASLGIAEGTVKMHLHNVYAKLGLESRTQLAMTMRAAA